MHRKPLHLARFGKYPREAAPSFHELRDVAGYPAKDRRMRDLDAALGHHLNQVPIRQPVGDIPTHAQLDDVGVEYPLAIHRITGNRLRHSAPRATFPTAYPMPIDASEPSLRCALKNLCQINGPNWGTAQLTSNARPSRTAPPQPRRSQQGE